MDDVSVGLGDLAGKGVHAAREFAAGEVVLRYELVPLTAAEYTALSPGEDLFVHSFGGRRYLYPAPARYVNHSADPSCFQDFDQCCEIALRPIRTGEPITIDAHQETARELATYLDAYEAALTARSTPLLGALVDSEATSWVTGRGARGRDAVVAAALDGRVRLRNVQWLVGSGRWEALASAETGDGRQHVSMLVTVVAGNWQLSYVHVG